MILNHTKMIAFSNSKKNASKNCNEVLFLAIRFAKFENLTVYFVQEALLYIVARIAKLFTTKRREVGNFS